MKSQTRLPTPGTPNACTTSTPLTQYVAGFLFRKNGAEVALIKKTHPDWQRGKLNAVGGKIEEGESPDEAMSREFREETGGEVEGWRMFCQLTAKTWTVYFFVAQSDVATLESKTEEHVDWYPVKDLAKHPRLQNLNWLIPMALDPSDIAASAYETR